MSGGTLGDVVVSGLISSVIASSDPLNDVFETSAFETAGGPSKEVTNVVDGITADVFVTMITFDDDSVIPSFGPSDVLETLVEEIVETSTRFSIDVMNLLLVATGGDTLPKH